MRTVSYRRIRCCLLLLAVSSFSRSVHGQALITAGRQTAVTPFAEMTLLGPDWGPTTNLGYTVGVDYTHFIRARVQPSLELRATGANGTTVNEHSYVGGLQLQTSLRNVYPYITALAGYGGIHFDYNNGGYLGDNSAIYSLGGGVDVPLAHRTRLRLDFTRQSWNIDPQTLNPVTLSVGFAYTLSGGRGVTR